ncbi:type III PLP-dependent enzyme [Micromonospora endophytica]|uniref:Diaminopimelate decarboxylase n=1 Tax=Micromonospora endophytica TaxID=515350 RepID=A0A2W2DIE5_9ACTN|nr:type III PLP-dependent enzyme [Micromonospora endophytica]PZG00560.1 diaminopimelate decarboxylase [Micromonospora endophytica]RIW45826.1 type III PLP-dependent enzyme [Micromonospora endophytica]BCJ61919.1 diaminopimelate decarboxylase [Micromonospora endophytica]
MTEPAIDCHTVQGVPVAELADRYGTPLYLYDGEVIRETYQQLRGLLDASVEIYYSLKANPNISICSLLHSLGAGAEVSSLAELVTARRAGVPAGDVIFLGPGKSTAELAACIEQGIGAIVCESLDEVVTVDAMAGTLRRATSEPVRVVLRVNPAFVTKGSRLAMGGKPRQFGIDQELVADAGPTLRALRQVRVIGLHAYMGTRILDAADIAHNTHSVLTAAADLAAALDLRLDLVDVGGGFGVPYFDNESSLDIAAVADGVNSAVARFRGTHPDTRIITELGRYLVGWAGTYVVRARYVKASRGEWFVVADGGTNHHMAAVGIGSFVKRNFPIRSLSRPAEPAARDYTVTGPLCTPNDVIGKKVPLPEVRPGDLIGVERSGAYGPSASPVLFLSHGHPAEVLVLDGEAHLVRRADTVEDLLRPQHLVVPAAPAPAAPAPGVPVPAGPAAP